MLTDTPGARLGAHLRQMHAELARTHPAWDDRIEVIYISAHGLATCRTHPTTIAVISPGQPFHVVAAGRDWNPQLVSRSRAWGAAARAADRHTDPTDPHRLRETGRRLGISYPSHVGVSDPLAGWIRGHKQRDRRRQPPDPLELAGMPESIIFAVRRVGARGARDQPPLLTEAETSATFLASTHETRSQSH